MVNQSVNEFYTQCLFEIDALPQYVMLLLDITTTFFKNLSLQVRKLLITEKVQFPPIPLNETNQQENQKIILVRNAAVEAEKKIITINAAVQPASRSCHLAADLINLLP